MPETLSSSFWFSLVMDGDTRDPMCHDVMAGGRQREGILQEGVCKGGRGLQILCLDLHRALWIQTQGPGGREIYNLPISFIVGANYLHTLPFYLYALSIKWACLIKVLELESVLSSGVRLRHVMSGMKLFNWNIPNSNRFSRPVNKLRLHLIEGQYPGIWIF